MNAGKHILVRDLADKIRSIEQRYQVGRAAAPLIEADMPIAAAIPTGWASIDAALGGGLPIAGLHEFFGVVGAGDEETARVGGAPEGGNGRGKPLLESSGTHGNARTWEGIPKQRGCEKGFSHQRSSHQQLSHQRGRWSPPFCILAHLAWQAVHHDPLLRWTAWVGRACHPYPRLLVRGVQDRRLLQHSLFVAPRDVVTRLWAIDLTLRCPAIGVVIADGSGLDRAATQRLQLLARCETKCLLAARPPQERSKLSAAQTRWLVRSTPSPPENKTIVGVRPRWSVELLRCKGVRPAGDRIWLLEWNRAESAVHLSAPLADLAGAAQEPTRSEQPATRRRA